MKYLFKSVNAVLAALFFPAVIFLDLIFFQASTSLTDYGLEESFSLKRIIDILSGNDPLSSIIKSDGEFSWPSGLASLNSRLIGFAAAFAVAALAAIFIIVFSICSSKRIPILAAAGIGLVASIIMITCFNSAAGDVVDGTVNLVSAIGGSGILVSILGGIVNVDKLMLGGFHNAMIIIFVMIILWTLSFILIELGDNTQKVKKH